VPPGKRINPTVVRFADIVITSIPGWQAGVIGMSLLFVYVVGTTFGLAPVGVLMTTAVPGGLMMIAWYVMGARKLFRLARTP